MNTPRRRRTTIAGARAQFASIAADVLNVSSSGALLRAAQQHRPGTQSPLLLEMDGVSIPLVARVVRCEPVAGPLTTSTGQFTLALTFVDPSDEALGQLEQMCRTGRDAIDVRRLRVSTVRRCPKCQSRNVAKEGRRNYSCCHCGQVFTGFRIGFLRFSR